MSPMIKLYISNLSNAAVLVTVQCVKLIGFSILSRSIFTIITEQILLDVEVIFVFSQIVFIQSLQRSKSNILLLKDCSWGAVGELEQTNEEEYWNYIFPRIC